MTALCRDWRLALRLHDNVHLEALLSRICKCAQTRHQRYLQLLFRKAETNVG